MYKRFEMEETYLEYFYLLYLANKFNMKINTKQPELSAGI